LPHNPRGMLIASLHDRRDPEPEKIRVPKVKILRLGHEQKFSPNEVFAGVMGGYITLARGRLVVHAATPGATARSETDVVFRIRRRPGLYCCHCGRGQASSLAAQNHVRANHSGVVSPDPQNPAGYEQLNALDCVRE
jgi:hypothetical protein